MSKAEFSSSDARNRITEVRKASLVGGDDDEAPAAPLLDRARTVA